MGVMAAATVLGVIRLLGALSSARVVKPDAFHCGLIDAGFKRLEIADAVSTCTVDADAGAARFIANT
jgi:hypothetical protein